MTNPKFCVHETCLRKEDRRSRSYCGIPLCSEHLDEYLEKKEAEHHCSAPAEPSLGDAVVGYAICSCGERVELDDDVRREVADRITSDLETLNREVL